MTDHAASPRTFDRTASDPAALPPPATRPRTASLSRRAFSLLEVVITLAIICMLVYPFVQMMVGNQRRLTGLPRRLCALWYAQDLLEERLDKTRFARAVSISRRRLIDFMWIRDNVSQMEAAETGERKARIAASREFLAQFDAEVVVVDQVPGRRKLIRASVYWSEGGHRESLSLESTLEQ